MLLTLLISSFKKLLHFMEYGLPMTMASNSDAKFVSYFSRTLRKLPKTKLKFSAAFHPQTDGQIEVVNRSLGDLLRCLVGDHGSTWDQYFLWLKLHTTAL